MLSIMKWTFMISVQSTDEILNNNCIKGSTNRKVMTSIECCCSVYREIVFVGWLTNKSFWTFILSVIRSFSLCLEGSRFVPPPGHQKKETSFFWTVKMTNDFKFLSHRSHKLSLINRLSSSTHESNFQKDLSSKLPSRFQDEYCRSRWTETESTAPQRRP